MAMIMKASAIKAGHPYRGAALQERPGAQAHGTSFCLRKVYQENFVSQLYQNSMAESSVFRQSAYGSGAGTRASGLGRFTGKSDPVNFRSGFGTLSGGCNQASGSVSLNFKQADRIRAATDVGANGNGKLRYENEDVGHASVWYLSVPYETLKSAATKVGDAFRDMMTNQSTKFKNRINIKASTVKERQREPEQVKTEWDQWEKVFTEVDERENLASVLRFHLQEAVEKEDFQEAATLKNALAAVSTGDAVFDVMNELKQALAEERYKDVTNLRDKGGAWLVGWWVALAESQNDLFGRIIHISAAQGRFIARTYNARQLASAGQGVPLFELFVIKHGDNNYSQQAVYLQHDGNLYPETPSSEDINVNEDSSSDVDKDRDDNSTEDSPTHESISGGRNIVEEQQIPVNLTADMQNSVSDKISEAPVRVPAKLERKTKDSFVISKDDVYQPGVWRSTIAQSETICDRFDVCKESTGDMFSTGTGISKVSKEISEMMRLAVKQTRGSGPLGRSTSFRKMNVSEVSDRLSGLFIGDFGPYKSEVVQLRRRFGTWTGGESSTNCSELEFCEYVEAVKLTGDSDVPSGQVLFRAKIGKGSSLSVRGTYPEGLRVTGRYHGHGRLAIPGFRNPQWIDGEVVLFDGKRGGQTNGTELGFVYCLPERRFLVLFNRLKLQD
ncbi:hypothetical protein R1flu_018683 [Riccia fluitans]|uniref:Uncharacterized protein n=1 Tax=Riccia fluitans TaxID=41844 RepID=A0ABD1ZHY3_9MARC